MLLIFGMAEITPLHPGRENEVVIPERHIRSIRRVRDDGACIDIDAGYFAENLYTVVLL